MAAFFPSLPHIEDCPKRIRTYLGGVCLIDTKKAKLVLSFTIQKPLYFFTKDDLPPWYLEVDHQDEHRIIYHLLIDSPNSRSAIALHLKGPLAGLLEVKFDKMDAWFEEEEQIYVHPKDPYKRVDALPSSRHIRIEVGGIEVANTRRPHLLFETGLPTRYYIPKTDCRMDLWVASPKVTSCPYKGDAHYYNVVLSSGDTFENIIWCYSHPTSECAGIKGLVAFFDEKVDMWIDDVKQERPVTKWT
ncbi:hypothetical protein CVT24_008514 [Panaeolus cyanescens]|uniref:DUF427 domain-containing protein n=1 Tax=Panaeolus cyanescens TaxID=181874 RepID=A0A409VKV2_9AGAR|nr:hypothetical protein CVT24_008514 [Panaeolus cyanescens]